MSLRNEKDKKNSALPTDSASSPIFERMAELTFGSVKTYTNPFNDVDVDVIFERDKESWRVPAFWSTGNQWAVRFEPPAPGEYSYRLESTDKSNLDLNDRKGKVIITTYSGNMPSVDVEGTVHMPAFSIPVSSHMSEEARRTYVSLAWRPHKIHSDEILESRKFVDDFYRPLVEHAKAVYQVNIEEHWINGVRMDVVTPQAGIATRNCNRVLINLHGGGFVVGAGLGGLAESIPIADVGKIKVISIDYRMWPESTFPAGVEDVTSVYRELLKQYEPENIGIYGCSAGGTLSGQAIAWFQKESLPVPGAIGIHCGGADLHWGGDSKYLATSLNIEFGVDSVPPAKPNPPEHRMPYFDGRDMNDPLLSPIVSPEVLSNFPPTLVITGTRDLLMSTAVHTHTQLVKAGVQANLHVWEGMWHNFLFYVNMPEAKEAYDVIVRFFDQHLDSRKKVNHYEKG